MPDIRHLIFIYSTPEKIYEAITTQKGIGSWWSTHNNAKPEEGSVYRVSFGSDYYKEIKVAELLPNKKIVWEILDATPEWLNTRVEFEIRMGKLTAELRFVHSGWKEYTDMFAQCSFHWAVFLANLKAFAEKDKPFAMNEFLKIIRQVRQTGPGRFPEARERNFPKSKLSCPEQYRSFVIIKIIF